MDSFIFYQTINLEFTSCLDPRGYHVTMIGSVGITNLRLETAFGMLPKLVFRVQFQTQFTIRRIPRLIKFKCSSVKLYFEKISSLCQVVPTPSHMGPVLVRAEKGGNLKWQKGTVTDAKAHGKSWRYEVTYAAGRHRSHES